MSFNISHNGGKHAKVEIKEFAPSLSNKPMRAQKTKMMLTIMNISIAVRPSALGMLLVMLLKILTRTRKTVTRIVMRPGTLSGGTRKLIMMIIMIMILVVLIMRRIMLRIKMTVIMVKVMVCIILKMMLMNRRMRMIMMILNMMMITMET